MIYDTIGRGAPKNPRSLFLRQRPHPSHTIQTWPFNHQPPVIPLKASKSTTLETTNKPARQKKTGQCVLTD